MNSVQIAFTLLALGQQPAAAPADKSAAQVHSVLDFIIKGGPVMIPIGLCSLVALTVIVERLWSLRKPLIIPPDFLPGLQQLMKRSEPDTAAALDYCVGNASPVAQIFAAGLKRLGEPVELLEKHVQEAGERQVLKLHKYMRLLSMIASVSTLLGLLGTILGLINAFGAVAASGEALGKTELLAKGIYEAMITTAAGLFVAIPAVVAHHGLSSKIERLVVEMDQMTVEFLEECGEADRQSTRPATLPRTAPRSIESPAEPVAA